MHFVFCFLVDICPQRVRVCDAHVVHPRVYPTMMDVWMDPLEARKKALARLPFCY